MARNDEYEIPETGAIFTFGRSRFADNLSSHFFVRNDPVVEISCGDEHTALVCKSGRVFLFGKNDYGQLGFGHTKAVNKPSCLKYLKPFQSVHVACGKSHTIVSTACGKLFTFGCNSDGQLGIGHQEDRSVPQLVPASLENGESIIAVSAGCYHSALLTGRGELYLWGNNSDGQCGEESLKQILLPRKIEFEEKISTVSCGYYHTAFISNGETYTFGEEDNGKLGRPKTSSNNVPGKVQMAETECVSVRCGGNHTIIQTGSGKAFAFGSNFSGQLGIGNFESEFSAPQLVKFSDGTAKVSYISCGESHSAFVTETGELYTCGDARHGKLCNEDESNNLILPTLSDTFSNYFCVFVSCGGCHTMVLAKAKNPDREKLSESLPPLKLSTGMKNYRSDSEEISEIKTNEKKNENGANGDARNSAEEFDNKSNTESNLNDEIPSQREEIYAEVLDVKKGAVEKVISRVDSSVEVVNDTDEVVAPKENTIKRFLTKLKRKKSGPKMIFRDEMSSNIQGTNNTIKGNHTASKACIVL